MKNIVATAAVVAVTAILASTTGFAQVDNSGRAEPTVSNYTANGFEQSQVEKIAARFRSQGAWVVVNADGGKDVAAAVEHAGVVLTILGLGGVALLARIRLQAVRLAQRANRQPLY